MTRPALRLVRVDPDGVDGDVAESIDDAPTADTVRLLVPSTQPTAAHLAWCNAVDDAFDRLELLATAEDP